MARIYDYNKNEWVTVNTASDIAIRDLSESFGGAVNVEEALQHVAKDITEGQNDIADCKKSLEEHSEWIDWLKVNGGGGGGGTGGGSSAPIISSTLTESSFIVDKGTSVILPIYFQSPNLGDGVLIVAIDGVEVDSFSIKQGNNNVNIGELPNLSNRVSVYAKDRTGKLSNQLDWTIICGGIDLTLDFDYNVDYTVGSTIYMPFNIYSPTDEPVVLNIDIAGEKRQMQCNQGYNEYVFRDLGVGVHTITIQATDGTYNSQAITFNIVIVDADSLYLSTTFENGCEIELGLPVVIDYRISNPNDEYMTVNQYLDGELYKTLSAKRGAYSWTLNGLNTTKEYTYKIEVIASNGTREVEGTFNVVKGAYTPVQVNTQGLAYRLYAGDRTNQDLDRQNPVYEGISATLHDFNFSSNGWIDGVLKCNGGSYVEIDYSPWSDNAPNGCTIEIDFKATNVGDLDSRVLEYKDSGTNKGIFIGVEEAKINSISNEGKVFVNANEWTTISFVIDRKTKFAKVFINGVCTRAFKLSDSGSGVNAILEDFAFDGKMYLNCTKELTNAGECDIKDLRVYRRPLTDDEIVKNVIAQETDLQKQKELYDFNFNNTSLPVMRMYGDTSNMTLETPVPMRIKYSSPNTEKYGQPFDLPYCQVNWQGTSSLDYVLKNYNIVLKDANMADAYYSPYPNGVPENIFCLKADYMESSHSRNVGIAKFVEACLYSTKNPAQVKNPNVRNSVEGFPILLYINDELQGVYNFNTDRRSTNTFGYTDENNHLVYEISANSDTTAGAFIKWSADTGKSEIDYYKSDFSCIYPPTRVAGNDNFAEIKRLVEWVDNASDEDFRDNLDQYFNREYLIRYYLFVMLFGAVDSLGKNMKLASWDGRIWYPQVYDCDTTIGLDNTGFLKFDSDIEVGDPNTFNTTGSKLWSKVKLLLDDEIKAQYSLIRQNKFTLDNLFKYIVEEQMDKIPATFYNKDMQTKYLNWGSSYLYALHGRGKQQIKTWLTERLLYIDTLMGYDVSTSDYVTIRSSKLGEVYLDIETFNSMYLNVKWRNTVDNSSSQRLKVKKGEKVRFSFNMPTATDQEIRVYGGKYIKSLGDLSNLQPTTLLLAKAPGITELTCHSTNLINTDLSECTNLKRVDLSGCTQLGSGVGAQSVVDVSKCTNIQYVNCQDTQITSVKLNALGSNIREIWYPNSIQEITLSECPNLKTVGLQYGHNCKSIKLINCPNVEAFGDRKWNKSTLKYTYPNGYFLGGVSNLYLDNSFLKEEEIAILGSTGINSVTLKNMPNARELTLSERVTIERLATGSIHSRPWTPELEKVKEFGDFELHISNCPNLKTFNTKTNYLRYDWFSDYDVRRVNLIKDKLPTNQYQESRYYQSGFHANICDLSDSQFENINLYITSYIAGLVLPTTVKSVRINPGVKFFKDNQLEYLYTGSYTGNYNPSDWGWDGTGMARSAIYSISDSVSTLEDRKWKMGAFELEDLEFVCNRTAGAIGSNHVYTDYKGLELLDLNLKAHNYTPMLYDELFSNKTGTLDLSEFNGISLYYALANITDNLNVILPTDLSQIQFIGNIIKGANTTQIGWDFAEKTYPLISNRNDIELGLRNTILREQMDESEAIDLINTKYKGDCYYGNPTGWFEGSNLKYVGNVELSVNSPSGMFRNSNVIKIGDMHFGKGATTSYAIGLRYLCMDNKSLVSVGNITIDYNNVSTTSSANSHAFQNCTNLTSIGDVRFINFPTEAPGLDFSNWFRNIGNITSMGNLQGLKYAQTVAYMFYGTRITCDLDLTPLSESILLNNMVYAFQNANATKITLPSTYKTTLEVETYSMFLGAKIGTLIFPALPPKAKSLQEMFTTATIEDLTFAEDIPETVTSCNVMFNRATIGNLKMSQYIPNSVKTCTSMFKEATIGSTTMTTLPIFREGSKCTDISNMYDSYKGTVNIHSPFVVPSGVVKMPSFASYGYLPTDFVLDCSKVEYVISNRWLFTTCKNLVNFTYILPKYIYADNVGNEVSDSSRFLLATDYSYNHTIDTLRSVTFDWSNYLGSNAGMYCAVGGASSKGLTVNGIDYNLFGHTNALAVSANAILNDFTVHAPCNSRNINIGRVRMSKNNCLKFVDEALAELDWSNRLAGATWTSRGAYKDSSLFPVKPGVTYTFDKGTENGYYGGQFSLKFYDNEQTHLSNIAGDSFSDKGTYTVFTVPSNDSIGYASITLMKNGDVCTDEQLSQSTVIVGNRGYSISNSSITFTGLNNPSSISIDVTDNALKPLIKSGGFIAYDSKGTKIWQGSITSSTNYPYTVTGMHGGTISKIVVTFGGLTYEQVSNAVQKGNIKVTIGDVLKTPTIYTLTLSRYTDGAGSTLSSDDQAEIISKATLKGWNVTFA